MSGDNVAAARAPVTVSLDALEEGTVTFSTLEEAFGSESLGIIVVKDLPARFIELRRRLLSYSSHLANLPADKLAELENPRAKWLVGWSRGREMLRDGVYDTQKGSFYVNCAFYKDPTLTGASGNYPDFPEYTAPNIWPDESILPGFRSTFEELCRLIIDTAVLVARACDRYAEHAIHGYRRGCLERIVRESTTTKARLLHYFPSERSYASASGELADDRDRKSSGHDLGDVDDDDDDDDGVDDGGDTSDWCAPHLDHGCLTGLTSAMYVDELAQSACIRATAADQAPPPLKELDPSTLPRSAGYSKAGLYILSRTNSPVKVSIPPDHLAFQTGEALQVITRGRFKAVPHFVRGPRSGRRGSRKERDLGKERERGVDREMMGVARNTLAVFTQPNLADLIIDDEDDGDEADGEDMDAEDRDDNDNENRTARKMMRKRKDFATFARETVQKYNPVSTYLFLALSCWLSRANRATSIVQFSGRLVVLSSSPLVQLSEWSSGYPVI